MQRLMADWAAQSWDSMPASRGFNTPWGAVMAGSTIAVIPLIVLFLIFQKQYISGLTAGAVKQ